MGWPKVSPWSCWTTWCFRSMLMAKQTHNQVIRIVVAEKKNPYTCSIVVSRKNKFGFYRVCYEQVRWGYERKAEATSLSSLVFDQSPNLAFFHSSVEKKGAALKIAVLFIALSLLHPRSRRERSFSHLTVRRKPMWRHSVSPSYDDWSRGVSLKYSHSQRTNRYGLANRKMKLVPLCTSLSEPEWWGAHVFSVWQVTPDVQPDSRLETWVPRTLCTVLMVSRPYWW